MKALPLKVPPAYLLPTLPPALSPTWPRAPKRQVVRFLNSNLAFPQSLDPS